MRTIEAEDGLDGNVHGPTELFVSNNSKETKIGGEPEMVLEEVGNVLNETIVDGVIRNLVLMK